MKGRIIAFRVSDADFATLEVLKTAKGIGWNQLLLEPADTAYGLTLESARPAKRKAEVVEEEAEPAETGKKKGGRKKAGKQEPPTAEAGPDAAIQETETEG